MVSLLVFTDYWALNAGLLWKANTKKRACFGAIRIELIKNVAKFKQLSSFLFLILIVIRITVRSYYLARIMISCSTESKLR